MKILYTVDCRPRGGGAPISSGILIESLIESNPEIQIGLLMPDCKEKYQFENYIDVFRISKFNDSFPYMFLKPLQWLELVYLIKRVIKFYKPNIIHCQMPKVAMAVSVLKKLKLIDKNIVLIYTDREHFANLKKKHIPIYRYFIGKEYDAVISLSDINARFWQKRIPRLNVEVIPNPAGRLYECSMEQSKINKYNGQNKLSLLFVGRMDPVKNWDLACDIISLTVNMDVHSSVVLSYKENDKEKCLLYEKIVKETGANATFYYNLNETEMISMFDQADIFIITSHSESFGRTIIEAMSRKCVVLGTNGGAIPEVIGYEKNVLPYNPEDFIQRIYYYNNNPDCLEVDKERYYQRYKECYTMDKCREKTLSLYKKIIKKRFNNRKKGDINGRQ